MATILVVEDNIDQAKMIDDILELEGHNVTVITQPYYFIDTVEEIQPDIILMDILLPGPDSGINLIKNLKQIALFKDIPVIGITAVPTTEIVHACYEADFQRVLGKPFTFTELLHTVASFLPC